LEVYTSIGFYGGYGNEFIYSNDNFIFSFEENDDDVTQNMKLSHVTSVYDIFNWSWFWYCDLYMKNTKLYVGKSRYYENNVSGDDSNIIEEIEAFKVVEQ